MVTTTHLLISNIIYNYCLKKLNIRLNRLNFAYGNVKPDFGQDKPNHRRYLNVIREYSEQLIESKMTDKNYSIILGKTCHFVCDYFCLYHTEKYRNKSLFKHLTYEIILDFTLVWLLISRKLKIVINKDISENDPVLIINKLNENYNKDTRSITKDITYAISASVMVVELIVSSSFKYKYLKDSQKIS